MKAPMKMKYLTVLAALVAASSATSVALAVQKHDPQFERTLVPYPEGSDVNLVAQVRNQNGSPKAKPDLYVCLPAKAGTDRDLAASIRCQNGSPKQKADLSFYIAPLK